MVRKSQPLRSAASTWQARLAVTVLEQQLLQLPSSDSIPGWLSLNLCKAMEALQASQDGMRCQVCHQVVSHLQATLACLPHSLQPFAAAVLHGFLFLSTQEVRQAVGQAAQGDSLAAASTWCLTGEEYGKLVVALDLHESALQAVWWQQLGQWQSAAAPASETAEAAGRLGQEGAQRIALLQQLLRGHPGLGPGLLAAMAPPPAGPAAAHEAAHCQLPGPAAPASTQQDSKAQQLLLEGGLLVMEALAAGSVPVHDLQLPGCLAAVAGLLAMALQGIPHELQVVVLDQPGASLPPANTGQHLPPPANTGSSGEAGAAANLAHQQLCQAVVLPCLQLATCLLPRVQPGLKQVLQGALRCLQASSARVALHPPSTYVAATAASLGAACVALLQPQTTATQSLCGQAQQLSQTTTRLDTPSGQQPGVGGQQPGVGGQQPGVGGQQPGVGGQQPGVGGQQPGVGEQQPGVGEQQPGVGEHPLPTSSSLSSTPPCQAASPSSAQQPYQGDGCTGVNPPSPSSSGWCWAAWGLEPPGGAPGRAAGQPLLLSQGCRSGLGEGRSKGQGSGWMAGLACGQVPAACARTSLALHLFHATHPPAACEDCPTPTAPQPAVDPASAAPSDLPCATEWVWEQQLAGFLCAAAWPGLPGWSPLWASVWQAGSWLGGADPCSPAAVSLALLCLLATTHGPQPPDVSSSSSSSSSNSSSNSSSSSSSGSDSDSTPSAKLRPAATTVPLQEVLLGMAMEALQLVSEPVSQQAIMLCALHQPHLRAALDAALGWRGGQVLPSVQRSLVALSNRRVARRALAGGVALSQADEAASVSAAAAELLPFAVLAPDQLLQRLVQDVLHAPGQLSAVLQLLLGVYQPVAAAPSGQGGPRLLPVLQQALWVADPSELSSAMALLQGLMGAQQQQGRAAAGLAVMELLLGPCGLDERRSGPHTWLWEEAGAAADLAPAATECVLGLARLLQHAYKAPDYSSIDRLVELMEGLVQSLVKAVDREDESSMQPWVAMVAQQVLSGSLGLQPPVLFILLPLLDLGVVYKASGTSGVEEGGATATRLLQQLMPSSVWRRPPGHQEPADVQALLQQQVEHALWFATSSDHHAKLLATQGIARLRELQEDAVQDALQHAGAHGSTVPDDRASLVMHGLLGLLEASVNKPGQGRVPGTASTAACVAGSMQRGMQRSLACSRAVQELREAVTASLTRILPRLASSQSQRLQGLGILSVLGLCPPGTSLVQEWQDRVVDAHARMPSSTLPACALPSLMCAFSLHLVCQAAAAVAPCTHAGSGSGEVEVHRCLQHLVTGVRKLVATRALTAQSPGPSPSPLSLAQSRGWLMEVGLQEVLLCMSGWDHPLLMAAALGLLPHVSCADALRCVLYRVRLMEGKQAKALELAVLHMAEEGMEG
ncbi:hypothetical protein QJQ45_006953 [Haematococcus lacustris]|nr:hypothetical protein QJQ45_006953 [Haematococcus lacustris]